MNKNTTPSFIKENKDLLIAGGAILVLASAGFAWYYVKKKKQSTDVNTASILEEKSVSNPISASTIQPVKKSMQYEVKYGSKNEGVEILQRYLKIYKEDLGVSGANRDGIDGVFGPKTARAAKKRLGKAVFTKADIEAMRKTLKSTNRL